MKVQENYSEMIDKNNEVSQTHNLEGKVIEDLNKPKLKNISEDTPIYILPALLCSCGYQMILDRINYREFMATYFCSNLSCSENLINKSIHLPIIRDYYIIPVDSFV